MDILQSIVLGAIEGLTEFLPVSSTGHLILTSELMGIEQTEFIKTFEVVIQLGSILAVLVLFRDKIIPKSFKDKKVLKVWQKLIVAFIPTGILGFLLYKYIKELFAPETVAFMLIFGGFVFIAIEYFHKKEPKVNSIEEITLKDALAIGFFQSLAMIPGTSRSGATIIGGLLMGFNRKVATEFSFLLAVPTMFIATIYDVYKNFHSLEFENWALILIAFITAFSFAILAVKTFLAFISKFNFVPFGIYRILIGIVFLYYLY